MREERIVEKMKMAKEDDKREPASIFSLTQNVASCVASWIIFLNHG